MVCLLLLPSATVAGADSLMVQPIGDLSGEVAEAIASEVAMVPVLAASRPLDPRTTPIILATGKAFVGQSRGRGKRVGKLRPTERTTIRQDYDAGQVTLLLDASTPHDMSPAAQVSHWCYYDCSAMIRRSAASQLKVGSALISFLT